MVVFSNNHENKEMIAKLRNFDFNTNFPCQYQRKSREKIMENMDTNVRVYRVKSSLNAHEYLLFYQ